MFFKFISDKSVNAPAVSELSFYGCCHPCLKKETLKIGTSRNSYLEIQMYCPDVLKLYTCIIVSLYANFLYI